MTSARRLPGRQLCRAGRRPGSRPRSPEAVRGAGAGSWGGLCLARFLPPGAGLAACGTREGGRFAGASRAARPRVAGASSWPQVQRGPLRALRSAPRPASSGPGSGVKGAGEGRGSASAQPACGRGLVGRGPGGSTSPLGQAAPVRHPDRVLDGRWARPPPAWPGLARPWPPPQLARGWPPAPGARAGLEAQRPDVRAHLPRGDRRQTRVTGARRGAGLGSGAGRGGSPGRLLRLRPPVLPKSASRLQTGVRYRL